MIKFKNPGRSFEQMDTFFENGISWTAFKATRNIRDAGIEDWRWTKKLKEDDEGSRQSWKKRPVYTFSRICLNAGVMWYIRWAMVI